MRELNTRARVCRNGKKKKKKGREEKERKKEKEMKKVKEAIDSKKWRNNCSHSSYYERLINLIHLTTQQDMSEEQ